MKIFTKSSKQLRGKLLTGASVAILSVVLTTAQVAMTNAGEADRFDGRMWIKLQGAHNLYSGSTDIKNSASYGGPYSSSYTINSRAKSGFSGLLEAGAYLSENSLWSLALRAEFGKSTRKKTSFDAYSGAYNDLDDHKETYAIIDFEAQRDVGLGILGIPNTKAKARIGVRFAHFDAKTTASYGASYSNNKSHRKFTGAGPLVGLNTSTEIFSNDSTNLSFDTSSAFALLFGKRRNTGDSIAGHPTYRINEKRSKFKVVPNIDASAGLSVGLPFLNGTLGVGYRVNALFGLLDTGHLQDCTPSGGGVLLNCSGPKNGNRIIHGPYVNVKINLN